MVIAMSIQIEQFNGVRKRILNKSSQFNVSSRSCSSISSGFSGSDAGYVEEVNHEKTDILQVLQTLQIISLLSYERVMLFQKLVKEAEDRILGHSDKFGKHHVYKVIPVTDLVKMVDFAFDEYWNFEVINTVAKHFIVKNKLNVIVEASVKVNFSNDNSWSMLGGVSNKVYEKYNPKDLPRYVKEVKNDAIKDGLKRCILNLMTIQSYTNGELPNFIY